MDITSLDNNTAIILSENAVAPSQLTQQQSAFDGRRCGILWKTLMSHKLTVNVGCMLIGGKSCKLSAHRPPPMEVGGHPLSNLAKQSVVLLTSIRAIMTVLGGGWNGCWNWITLCVIWKVIFNFRLPPPLPPHWSNFPRVVDNNAVWKWARSLKCRTAGAFGL